MPDELSGFALVLDSIDFSGKLPFEIIPGHLFRKANRQEIKRIQKEISAHKYANVRYEYEFRTVEEHTYARLSPRNWRYFVIYFKGPNDKIANIRYAMNLLKFDLTLGYVFLDNFLGSKGVIFSPHISTFFIDHSIQLEMPQPLGNTELREITANYNLISSLDKNLYPNIYRAVSNYQQTKIITNISTLKMLSYFSIIECLLTHKPDPNDTIDSIRRQSVPRCFFSAKDLKEI